MKPLISLERRDAILAMTNKRTQTICALMDNNHVDSLEEVLRLVDRPVVTREELIHEPEDCTVAQFDKWYDLLANACRWLQNIGLTMTDHVPVYWFDDTTQVYYFDWEEGVYEETVSALMWYSTPYTGQKLVDSVDEIIPVILKPLMDEAIAEMNASAVNQLAEAIVYVIGMSIKQEREDG